MMMMMAEVDHQRKKGKEPMHRGEGERVCVLEKTKTRKWYHFLLTLIISLIIIIKKLLKISPPQIKNIYIYIYILIYLRKYISVYT